MVKKQQVWGEHLEHLPANDNVQICAGRDVNAVPMADAQLVQYDIWTNLVHAKMLYSIKVLEKQEYIDIHNALIEILDRNTEGDFLLDPAKEDVHINIEHFLINTKNILAAKKIHTGRSRNDQVTTDMRLYLRDQLIIFSHHLIKLIDTILVKAAPETLTYMPGFTHYQPAMITTFAHWLTNWSQALLRDLNEIEHCISLVNTSPLGAAAAFGTSWKINREFTADLLGFTTVQENTLDCITSRWEAEAEVAFRIAKIMNHFSIIAQDLILLSHPYYNMIMIDDAYVTGSSIMPQKRNPDFAEVIRSNTAVCHGLLNSLLSIPKGLISGYNRDTQQTKYLVMDLLRDSIDVPCLLNAVIQTLTVNREEMLQKCQIGFMNAADIADWLAQEYKLPFRDCYNVIALAVKYSKEEGQITSSALQKALDQKEITVKLTDKDHLLLEKPHLIIQKKLHTGAPSSTAVEKMIQSQTQLLNQKKQPIQQFSNKIEQLKTELFQKI